MSALHAALGWQEFDGTLLLVAQFWKQAASDFSRVTLSIRRAAPTDGVLDLAGPPW